MSILNLIHHRLDLFLLRYVAINHQRILQFLRNTFRIGFVLALRIGEIIDHAGRAAFAESLGHPGADAARAAGYEDNFAGKIERISHVERWEYDRTITQTGSPIKVMRTMPA